MEAIQATVENAQTKTLSQSQPTSTRIIRADEHAALFTVINQVRLLNGWTMRTAKELDPTIQVWHTAFADYDIPPAQYNALYKRCLDFKQTRLRDANVRVDIDAVLMIAQWTGTYGLKNELRQKEIDKARSLPENAESVCERCFGTGMETVKGEGLTWARKCDHGNA